MELQTSELTGSLKEEIWSIRKNTELLGPIKEVYCTQYIKYSFVLILNKSKIWNINRMQKILPSDMGPKMGVVIASSGRRLSTDAADVGLFTSVHLYQKKFHFLLQLSSVMIYLQMVGQIVTPWELLMAVLTFVIPVTRNISQPISIYPADCVTSSCQSKNIHVTGIICAYNRLFVPGARMLRHVTLPVALDSELEAAFVANKRFHSPVRSHVLLKQSFAQVRLWDRFENTIRKQCDSN